MADSSGEDHIVVDVQAVGALVASMETERENFSYESKFTWLCSIYRVPPSVRNVNKSDYDPKLISIGPYHHGAEALKGMEPLKWSYLEDLIARSPENSLDKYITAIFKLEPVIRAYYSEDIKLGRDALVKMMVVDGCFIVEFLIKWFLSEKDDSIGAVKWNLPLLQKDLLLLKNQIPFFVLVELFRVTTVPRPEINEDTTLRELAATYIAPDQLRSLLAPRPPPFPHHLLHLYHAALPRGFRANTRLR